MVHSCHIRRRYTAANWQIFNLTSWTSAKKVMPKSQTYWRGICWKLLCNETRAIAEKPQEAKKMWMWQNFKSFLSCLFGTTSAVPVLNMPVWKGGGVCLDCGASYVPLTQLYDLLSLLYCLCAELVKNNLWCRVRLQNFCFILSGLSAMKILLSMFFMVWNCNFFIVVYMCASYIRFNEI